MNQTVGIKFVWADATARMELIIGVKLVLVCVVDPNEYIRKMFIISILFRRFSLLPLEFTKGFLYKAQCEGFDSLQGNP